jgi:hypothetical protein
LCEVRNGVKILLYFDTVPKILHVVKVGWFATRLQIMVGGKRVEAGWRMVGKAVFLLFFAVLPPVKTGGYKMIDALSSFFGLIVICIKCTRL